MIKLKANFLILFSLTSYCWSNQDGLDYLEQKLVHEIISQKNTKQAAKDALVCFFGSATASIALEYLLAHFFPDTISAKNACKKMNMLTELTPITILLGSTYWAYADSQIKEKEKTLEAIQTFKAKNVPGENKSLDLQTFYQTLQR